jgi:hypothetical protein
MVAIQLFSTARDAIEDEVDEAGFSQDGKSRKICIGNDAELV